MYCDNVDMLTHHYKPNLCASARASSRVRPVAVAADFAAYAYIRD